MCAFKGFFLLIDLESTLLVVLQDSGTSPESYPRLPSPLGVLNIIEVMFVIS